jgi:hypothetical protein
MEVRLIKTCQGFQKVLFLDGALAQVYDREARSFLLKSELDELNEIVKQVSLADLPQRAIERTWQERPQ